MAAFLHVGLFLWLVAHRLGYPFPLEWLEGDEFHHALRVLRGQSWYPPPSSSFFPSYYPPGYSVVCAIGMRLFGTTLTAMRWVSVLSTLASCVAIYGMVRRHTAQASLGMVAAGFFVATYNLCGAWFDIARVDMLALALALVGVLLTHQQSTRRNYWLGIVLLIASGFTKQNHFAFLAAVVGMWFFWSWRRAALAMLLSTTLSGAVVALLQANSSGWFLFYTVTMPGFVVHEFDTLVEFARVTLVDMLGWTLPVHLMAAIVAVRLLPRRDLWLVWLVIVSVLVAASGWTNPAGFANNLIPVAAAMAIAVGVSLGVLQRHGRLPLVVVAHGLVILQLFAMRYDPQALQPTEQDRVAGERVVATMKQLPGPVLAPYHPYFLHLSGHPMHAHFHLVNEVIRARGFGKTLRDNQLVNGILRKLEQRWWRAYVSTSEQSMGELSNTWIDVRARRRYRKSLQLIPESDRKALYMRTGNAVRPCAIYLPR